MTFWSDDETNKKRQDRIRIAIYGDLRSKWDSGTATSPQPYVSRSTDRAEAIPKAIPRESPSQVHERRFAD